MLDRYGHLFPGYEGEAAAALDAYLEGTDDPLVQGIHGGQVKISRARHGSIAASA